MTCEHLIGCAEGVTHVREYLEMAVYAGGDDGALEQAGFLVSCGPGGG
ncbi:MAG: hypothetical protein VX911_02075 [Candidatus Latescibacterota bacterium]|nr:hypothetical protein [Candidatus Latescibacterota bacterium]